MKLTEDEIKQIVSLAQEAARPALKKIIGTQPSAYDKADTFMVTFCGLLEQRLEKDFS